MACPWSGWSDQVPFYAGIHGLQNKARIVGEIVGEGLFWLFLKV